MPQKPWVKELRTPPKQYQKGYTEFYKLKFFLTPDVLIPRPETELLVDEVLKLAGSGGQVSNSKTMLDQQSAISIIDIGTGSGCIAVSIAKNLKYCRILAIDKSPKALEVAEKNIKFHHVQNKVITKQNDLLEGFKKAADIIVCNLPYIPASKLLYIDPMVRDFEPISALDGGYDGFGLYRKLFSQIKGNNLYPKFLVAEIDEDQSVLAIQEVKINFPGAQVEIKKDLAKKDRIMFIKFTG